MKVLIDRYIPFLQGVLEPYCTVEFIEPEDFTASRVKDADALIVRTRTKINKELLSHSRVQFVATATIGYDHIDTAYCAEQHIAWTACPGCNAQAVCDYVEEVLLELVPLRTGNLACGVSPQPVHSHAPVVGVVGVGHVGTRVAAMAQQRGYQVLLNDPPKQIGIPLTELVAKADIITFHTPLNETTRYLCNADLLALCQPHALIINAARGGVVDESALLASGHPFVLDCWENEPHLQSTVLQSERCLRASYHIAGYSLEGKRNASQMCLDAFCHFAHLPMLRLNDSGIASGDSALGWLARLTDQLKAHPTAFETLRKKYPLR